jgi:hypothetical protein
LNDVNQQYETAKELVSLNSHHYVYSSMLAWSLHLLNRNQEALEEINRCFTLRIAPDDYLPHWTHGCILMAHCKFGEAIDKFDVALQKFKGHRSVHSFSYYSFPHSLQLAFHSLLFY